MFNSDSESHQSICFEALEFLLASDLAESENLDRWIDIEVSLLLAAGSEVELPPT